MRDEAMTSAVIADDEPLLRREIQDALQDLWPELKAIGEHGDGANVDCIDRVVRDADGRMTVRLCDGGKELPVSKPHQNPFRGMRGRPERAG